MKTHSFPLNKFKFSGSLASSHFLSSLTGSGRLPTVCEDNSQAADLTTRPCLPHLTTKPRPSNPQTRSLFTGKVAGGRLPHLRCRIRMPGKKRKSYRAARPPGPGAECVPPQRQEGDFQADLHPSHSSPHASSRSHLRKLASHSPKLQTHTRTCHASEMDKRPPPRGMQATQIGARCGFHFFSPVLFLSGFV